MLYNLGESVLTCHAEKVMIPPLNGYHFDNNFWVIRNGRLEWKYHPAHDVKLVYAHFHPNSAGL